MVVVVQTYIVTCIRRQLVVHAEYSVWLDAIHLTYNLVRHHLVPFEHLEHSDIGDFEHYCFEYSDFEHSENMAQPPPRERTLREIATPDFTYESLCIQYPDEDVPYWTDPFASKLSWSCRWRPTQTFERIPYCLLHHETPRCPGGSHIFEGLSSFFRGSGKGLALLPCSTVYHELGWPQESILRKNFPCFQDHDHQKRYFRN